MQSAVQCLYGKQQLFYLASKPLQIHGLELELEDKMALVGRLEGRLDALHTSVSKQDGLSVEVW